MELTKRQITFLNRYTKGKWTYNPATGLVDVDGSFIYNGRRAKSLSGIKFGKVSMDFSCYGNDITSLEGAPQEVGGDFDCAWNKLTSLKGAPQKVGGDFECWRNNLTSLVGVPKEVGGNFNCENYRWGYKLTSLEGAPQKVGGDFNCLGNDLTSLEGAPQKVGGSFDCRGNKLTSLEGAPQEVGGNFRCSSYYSSIWRNNLTSLVGAPQKVGGYFECDAFSLDKDQWNSKGWVEVWNEGSLKAKKLIPFLLTPKVLNKEIQQDPAGMVMKLKEIWNDKGFKETRYQLVWPKGYEDQADLVADLGDVGF
jgi:hypothetical protein